MRLTNYVVICLRWGVNGVHFQPFGKMCSAKTANRYGKGNGQTCHHFFQTVNKVDAKGASKPSCEGGLLHIITTCKDSGHIRR